MGSNDNQNTTKSFDPQLVPQYGNVYNSMDPENDSNKFWVKNQTVQNNIRNENRNQMVSEAESCNANVGFNSPKSTDETGDPKAERGQTVTNENSEKSLSNCFNLNNVVKNHYAETKFYLLVYAFLINFEVIIFITYWIYENDEAFNRYFLLFFYIPFLILYTFPNFRKLVLVAFLAVMALKIKMCSSLDNDTFTMILFFSLLAETIIYFVLSIS